MAEHGDDAGRDRETTRSADTAETTETTDTETTEHLAAQPYTVHADALAPGATARTRPATTSGGRAGLDPLALVAGLVALVVAALAMTGTLHQVDPRWVLAGGAVLVGGTVLVASLRRT